MINRKQEQGDEAIKQIKEESGQDTQVEWHGCDMGNLKQVQEVITRIRDKEDRLDLVSLELTVHIWPSRWLMILTSQLILSAGINTNAYGETHDGIDRHFQVNWLGQFYATNILYPLIRKTSKIPDAPTPRIVWESSRMHRMADENIRFENLNEINDSSIDPVKLYGRTKLAIILGVKYGLRDRVIKPNGDNIYVLSVHPGAVNTLMQHQYKDAYPGLMGQMMTYVNMAFGRNPEQGSYSALYAALSPEVKEKGWNGWYLEDPVCFSLLAVYQEIIC